MTAEIPRPSRAAKILFDTQALVMWISGIKLPPALQKMLTASKVDIYISVVSAWEFLLKKRFKEIGLNSSHIWEARRQMNARLLSLDPLHIDVFGKLPFIKNHHDPFDRMLIAQAICEGLPLAGGDKRFREYPQLKVIWR